MLKLCKTKGCKEHLLAGCITQKFDSWVADEDLKSLLNISLEVYPFNRPNDFILDLPESLVLERKWEVALMDIKVKSPKKSTFYLLADFCKESFLKGS